MPDPHRHPAPPAGPVGRALGSLAVGLAYGGGLVLVSIAALTVASVLKRAVFGRPIPGDYELVAMGCAIAVFLFLPLCQLRRGNVLVDVFTQKAPDWFRRLMAGLSALLYAGIAGVLLVQMRQGMLDRIDFGDTTMLLAVPIWPAFLPILAALALLVALCLHQAAGEFRALGGGDSRR